MMHLKGVKVITNKVLRERKDLVSNGPVSESFGHLIGLGSSSRPNSSLDEAMLNINTSESAPSLV